MLNPGQGTSGEPEEGDFDPAMAALGCTLGCWGLLLRIAMVAIALGALVVTIAVAFACFQAVV